MSGSIGQYSTLAPSILTDYSDYAPGSTANISLSGFGAFDPISLQIYLVDPVTGELSPGPAGVTSWTVADDANGNATASWYVDRAYAGTTIEITATDTTTGALATEVFTDSAPDGPALSNGGGEIDLTQGGALSVGGVVFATAAPASGTGIFNTFLRVDASGYEQGFNTNGALQFDSVGGHTHGIQLGGFATITVGGISYYQFNVGVNQSNSTPDISLDQFNIYVANSDTLEATTDGSGHFSGIQGGTLEYSLASNGKWIGLNANDGGHGNGVGNATILVPVSMFGSLPSSTWVYTYAEFGTQGSSWASNGGFESLGVLSSGTAAPAVSITKTLTGISAPSNIADSGAIDQAGQTLAYQIVVTNTGNVALSGVAVSDSLSGVSLSEQSDSLSVGQSETLSATYTVTQADVDAGGSIVNSATVTDAQSVTQSATANAVAIDQRPGVSISKSLIATANSNSDNWTGHAGDTINYRIVVSNSGNVDLTNVNVSDLLPGATLSGAQQNALAVGGSETLTASYVISQADVDSNAIISNTAAVTSTQASAVSNTVTAGVDYAPGVSIVKTLIGTDNTNGNEWIGDNGDTINYQIVVSNPGDVDLTNVNVGDLLPGATLSGTQQNALAVGGTETLTASYVISQSDVDSNAIISNTAAVTSTQASAVSNTVTAGVDYAPRVSIVKTLIGTDNTNHNGWTGDNGDTINYQIVVSNTGDVDLTNVNVGDLLPGATLSGAQQNALAVGGTETLTASYVISQADVDSNAIISNTAAVTSTQASAVSNTVTAGVDYAPGVSIVKTLIGTDNTNGNEWIGDNGDTINYQIVVSNPGDVDLTNVNVGDLLPGATLSGAQQNALAVGGTETLTASYVISQADVDSNAIISNTAAVTSTQASAVSNTVTAGVDYVPGVSIVKTLIGTDNTNGNGWIGDKDDTINYQIVVSNTGDVDLTNVNVGDLLPRATLSGAQQNALAVGGTETLTASYVISQADVDSNAIISNTAAVTSTQASAVSNTVTAGVDYAPGVSIVKTATVTDDSGDGTRDAGDVIHYKVVVANTGDVTLTGVAVADMLPGVTLSGLRSSLAVGASETLTGSYTITQADTDGGRTIINTATVSTQETSSQSASASVSLPPWTTGKTGLSIGYWYNHTTNWTQNTYSGPVSGYSHTSGVAIGAGGTGSETLFVPTAAATQLINSSATANDARQTLMSQALGAQLNVNSGIVDPGSHDSLSANVGLDLLGVAVHWMENDGPFHYSANTSNGGRVDGVGSTRDGVLETNTSSKTTAGFDYNTVNKAFTSTMLASSSDAWNVRDDIKVVDTNQTIHDFWVSGQDLKNALQAFDQGQLVTSGDGSLIGWKGSNGSITDVHGNSALGMWTVLQDQGMAHATAVG